MGRPQSTAGGRPHLVTVRLSDAEVRALDRMRGSVGRSAMLRNLLLRSNYEKHFPPEAETPSQKVDSQGL